jgi:hypothetical protein
MRYSVENSKMFPRGDQRPLGTCVEVVSALHELFPKRKWLTARKGIARDRAGEVEIFLTTRHNKSLPPSLEPLLFPLLEAQIPSDLFLDISAAIVLPDEAISMVSLNNAEETIDAIVEWAVIRGWQVREWNGPVVS